MAQIALLAGLVLAVHGRCLSHGLFMDDHPHWRQLREADWSLAGLTAACRLELFGNYCHAWWMPEVTLRFFRPVSFAIMKAVYELGSWQPVWQHAASLAWHTLACVLLAALLRRVGVHALIALAVAVLFAMHPAHVATVQWIAAQTELLVTVFLLGAALCWSQARGWERSSGRPLDGDANRGSATGRRWPWVAATGVLFAAALGCRENAILFPLVMLAVDPLMSRKGGPARRMLPAVAGYSILALIAAGYLLLRQQMLGGLALPPRPYVYPPGEPGFASFVAIKAAYYLLGQFALAPIVPFAGVEYLRANPATCAVLTCVVGVSLAAAWWLCRRNRAALLAATWLLLFMLPVLPSFESSHHLYLPGVGWALTLALVAQRLWFGAGQRTPAAGAGGESGDVHAARMAGSVRGDAGGGRDDCGAARALRRRRWVLGGLGAGTAGLLFVVSFYYSLTLHVAQQVEDNVVNELAAAHPPITSGQTLYIANLPLIAHYVRLPLEERLGVRDLRVVALTWAPRLLGTATAAELTWVDDRTIDLRIDEDRWFDGPLGVLARAAGDNPRPGAAGTRQFMPELEVRALESDADGGVSMLRVRFAKPPGETGARVFWGSRLRWAHEVRPR
ncbi:MAG: hypothetical protein IPM64_09415 [Phycisphaerales bacterium]|nr:hypothetical protein [Phycisphaerales bacterium]